MTMDTEVDPAILVDENSVARVRGLEQSALRGTYWVVIFYSLSMALRLGGSIVLTRLFMPQYLA